MRNATKTVQCFLQSPTSGFIVLVNILGFNSLSGHVVFFIYRGFRETNGQDGEQVSRSKSNGWVGYCISAVLDER